MMKKCIKHRAGSWPALLLPLALILLCGQTGYSQERGRFGLRGGLNVGSITGSGIIDSKGFKPAGHAGIYFRKRILDIQMQPEFLFSGKGTSYTTRFYDREVRVSSRPTYLDVPLFVNLSPSERFDVLVGPQGSLHVSGTAPTVPDTASRGETVRFSLFEFSMVAGGAYVFKSGIDIGARFCYGLTPVFAAKGSTPDVRHVTFQVTVGLLLQNSPKVEEKDRSNYNSVY